MYLVSSALAFLLGGSSLKGNLNLWADQRFASGLYDFVGSLPKYALLAGPLIEMDSLPLFTRRKVYVSDEAAQPLYDRYYAEVSSRLRRVFAVYHAVDARTVREFAIATGVRFMVVRKQDFTYRYDRPKTYHEPYDSYVKSLKEGKSAGDFWFAHPPAGSVVYEDRNSCRSCGAAVPAVRTGRTPLPQTAAQTVLSRLMSDLQQSGDVAEICAIQTPEASFTNDGGGGDDQVDLPAPWAAHLLVELSRGGRLARAERDRRFSGKERFRGGEFLAKPRAAQPLVEHDGWEQEPLPVFNQPPQKRSGPFRPAQAVDQR
jgi:hypothetical protein